MMGYMIYIYCVNIYIYQYLNIYKYLYILIYIVCEMITTIYLTNIYLLIWIQ